MSMGPGNGHWVRTRNEASAKSFLAEKEMERKRLSDARKRRRERRRRFFAAVERAGRTISRRVSGLLHRAEPD